MKVVNIKDIPKEDFMHAKPIEGWAGGDVHRKRQSIIRKGESENYFCSVINFSTGATTGWHIHNCDQILIVLEGEGFIADESEMIDIHPGDVVHIKSGEKHCHGAKGSEAMSHISVTTAGSIVTDVD